jgi:uncharacterized membrane protein YeaQ/YmgE (transglycosylase-associated protein family)
MSYLLFFGLFSWLVLGLAAGLTAPIVLGMKRGGAILVGMAGAMVGGGLATALGFGGLTSFDVRSLITAGLGAVLALLVVRLMQH